MSITTPCDSSYRHGTRSRQSTGRSMLAACNQSCHWKESSVTACCPGCRKQWPAGAGRDRYNVVGVQKPARNVPCRVSRAEVDLMLATPRQLPLYGKRVMVTAPRQYAQTLCQKLTAVGARPIWVPGVMIRMMEEEQFGELDDALRSLDRYTHIAFTSKNGMYALMHRLQRLIGGPADDDTLKSAAFHLASRSIRLCALGADGRVLEQMGLMVHVSPKEASTQGLVKELVERGEAKGSQILCPVPFVTGGLVEPPVVPRFLESLKAVGAIPTRVHAYLTTMALMPEDCVVEREMLLAGSIHAIAFSSTAEAQGLAYLMGGIETIQAAVNVHGVCLAAHGPYTADGSSKVLGLHINCISANFYTFDGVVDALQERCAWLEQGGQELR